MNELTGENTTLKKTKEDSKPGENIISYSLCSPPTSGKTSNQRNFKNNDELLSILNTKNEYYKKYIYSDKQFAFAKIMHPVSKEIHDIGIFEPQKETNLGKKKIRMIHSEKLLTTEIDNFLEKSNEFQHTKLFIYTLNSPCLQDKDCESCMDLLTKQAKEWNKLYSIETIVVFSKWYGKTGFSTRTIKQLNLNLNLIINSTNYEMYKEQLNCQSISLEMFKIIKHAIAPLLDSNGEVHFKLSKSAQNQLTKRMKNNSFNFNGTLKEFKKVITSGAQDYFASLKNIPPGKDFQQNKVKQCKELDKILEKDLNTFLEIEITEAINENDVCDYIKKHHVECLSFFFIT
ncbi:uncharacterized protein LOC109615678 [Esox lucius]|uniref:uncharacterized protein LOC109615678 n=1 Tax=Esox lucius TaxID=8010 RepID=UPI0014777838|nr:uncharacterized protein LOC109615678 [Esox lucius]